VALAGQQVLGSYRLLSIVKTGQTSQVWAAMNDLNQQRLALKVLLSDFRKDKEHVGYLKQEYVVGKGLSHKQVIDIYDYNVAQGIPFLAMEYFPYPNMKDIINQVREQVAFMIPKIVEQAALGLAYFNEQGWVHRDIKPDNFLVNDVGEVKLIDFALAKKKVSPLAAMFAGKNKKVQGTRSYMSPEQITGRTCGASSDVYSFGCTVFHLLSGFPPFTGLTGNELLNKHLKSPPPTLESQNRNVTAEFGDLIRRTLSKLPKNRPQTVGEFLKEFKAIDLYKVPPTPPGE